MVDELTTKKEENATLSVNQASCRGLLPIVVDLDGTLTPTDTLIEGVISTIQQNFCSLLFLPFWLMKGKSAFKEKIAAHAEIAAEHLPYHESFLSYLRKEKEKGRSILLATATHQSIAHKVATHLGLFDGVIASDAQHNLKGKAKLAAIREKITGGFIYAGDSDADLPIWKAAQGAILVGASPSVTKVVREHIPIEQEFIREKISAVDWLRALRVHQWLKNVLLFVPMLTAFSFTDLDKMAIMVVAFFSFSFVASATYIVNDLWDLGNDRMHPRKRLRPFASAKIPILYGLVMAGGMLLLAFFMAFVVSFNFFLMLCVYLILTSAYSWTLKQYVLIDVLMLSILYTLRILAGSVVIGIATSFWLLGFSIFIFFSLALVKRCSELVSLNQIGKHATRGRDYQVNDLVVLWPLGIGSALSAVVVFGLFISAPETQVRYATPELLWISAIGLIYWLARLWIKTARGEMHDDPIIYAIKDYGSQITILAIITVVIVAHWLTL